MGNSLLDKIKSIFIKKDEMVEETQYTDEVIDEMIRCDKLDFVEAIDDSKVLYLCQKYNSNIFIKELIKRDFSRIDNIISMVDENIFLFTVQKLFYEDLLEEMFKINYEETMGLFDKYSYAMDGLVENSDYLRVADILVEHKFSIEDCKNIDSIRNDPFLIASLQNNTKETLIDNDFNLSSLLSASNQGIVERICDIFKNYRVEDLPKAALENKNILSHYIKDKGKLNLILRILASTSYLEENEIELLKVFDNKYDSVEEVIKHIFNNENNKRRNDMSIYEILVIQIYAQKYLKKENILSCNIDMFKYAGDKSYGSSSKLSSMYTLYVINHNLSIGEIMRILHHEMTHVLQKERVTSMDLMGDRDTDLYTKDNLLKLVNKEIEDNIGYYYGNYSHLSIEYCAEYNAYLETAKLFGIDMTCYDKYKLNIDSLPEDIHMVIEENSLPPYYYDVNRKGKDGSIIHINDLVEMHLDTILKDDELRNKIEKEAPLILYEYDISKEESPRRRTIEELVNLLNNSNNKKDKDIYLMLLINRVDGRKEKELDLNNSVNEIKRLFEEGKISEKQTEFLLSAVIECKNNSEVKVKQK